MKRFLRRIPIFPIPYFLVVSLSLLFVLIKFLHGMGESGTVLGLRGTGDWSTDERPKNYRERILLLFPNSKMPLTALMSKLKTQKTTDPVFKIFEKNLPTQRQLVSGSHTSAVTTINLQGTTPAKVFKKGHALINERTLEVLWVTADPGGAFTSLTVARGKGSTAASMNDGDGLFVVGSHHQEGAAVPTAISYDPSVITNNTQIFRNSLYVTGTQSATETRTGNDLTERQREVLELHGIEREMAYIFGTGVEDTSGAQPERTTSGFLALVTTNVTDFADAVDIDTWEAFLEDIFEDGSNQKLMLAGNRAITVLNKIGRIHGEIELTPSTQTFGMDMQTYITPYGTLFLKQHPLLSKNISFRDWGIIVDTTYVVDRPLMGNGVNRDTHYRENVQSSGEDTRKDEYLSETGLELEHETVHGVAKNMSAFVP